jgi:predicted MFS family arabinose efflux permease
MVFVAFGWSFLYVGGNQLLVQRNAEKATATGILNSVIDAASIIGSITGGVMLEQFGYKETLIFAIICSLSGMVFFKAKLSSSLITTDKQQAGSSLKD